MSVSFKQYTKYNQKLWKFQCYLGKTEFGEQIRTTRSGFPTKKEAQKVYRQLQFDFDKNLLKMNGNMTFKELYEEFIEQYRLKVKPSTIMITRRAIEDHALEYFGNKLLSDISVRYCTQVNRRWVEMLINRLITFAELLLKFYSMVFNKNSSMRMQCEKQNPSSVVKLMSI